jgi:hypothetical protein
LRHWKLPLWHQKQANVSDVEIVALAEHDEDEQTKNRPRWWQEYKPKATR